MALPHVRRLVAVAGCGSLALALQVPAHAAAVSFTTITTPSGPRTVLVDTTTPHLTVAGTASGDVTTVTVYCIGGGSATVDATVVAADVVVTGGAFTVTAPVPVSATGDPICRLRALPQGIQPDDSVSAYAGPLLNVDTVKRTTEGGSTVDFSLLAGSGNGVMTATSAGKCGDGSLGTVPAGLGTPTHIDGCVASLGPSAAAGATGSLRVDGHLALLPYSVLAYTNGTSPLTVRFRAARSGQVTWSESANLVRCQSTDTYPPPSPGQCGNLVATGVRFERMSTFVARGNQVRVRDSFTSTDGHRHRVRTVYGMEFRAPSTGALGFAFPGRSGPFRGSTAGQVVTGLPRGAATFLVRSDRFSAEGDPQASTRAVTWSRTPSRLAFSADDATVLGMTYALTVPKHGSAHLGFTDSHAITTSSARALGTKAVADTMTSPRITSPAKGAVITGRKTVVKGTVRAGANGLPVSVKVNGHVATLTARSATRATYRVVFDESLGQHTLTAVARDAGGNRRSSSIKVRNQ